MKSKYWADQIADKLIKNRPKSKYVIASGITPSGTIHFGNFREIITTDLIGRALVDKGKKVRFIYSWDDYDVFRKVPGNMPKKNILTKELGKPVSKVKNVFGSKYDSYATHLEAELEESVKLVGVNPEFIRQGKNYPNLKYIKGIKKALEKRKKIAEILNKYRKEPLPKNWFPLTIYDPDTGYESKKIISYDNKYTITYENNEGKKKEINFKKTPGVKLLWKTDWPMRWSHEKVDFEPGGKDHSTLGGSYTVCKETVKLFGWIAPEYVMYDFINMKGSKGKMSSSKGNVQSLKEVLNYYTPELVRYTFAGRTPKTEIFYPMDEGIIKHYEDFYYTERVAYGKEKVSEKEKIQQERVYRMSLINKMQKSMPIQPSFKHTVELMNIFQGDIKKAIEHIKNNEKITKKSDLDRYKILLECSWNWINNFADDKYIFKVNKSKVKINLSNNQKNALIDLSNILTNKITAKQLFSEFPKIMDKNELNAKTFFPVIYKLLINKERGPRLAPFIIAIGINNVKKLINQ